MIMTNIAELLKNAPKGMKLYSPLFGEVELRLIQQYSGHIIVKAGNYSCNHEFYKDGRYFDYPYSECLLFPSKEVRTWEGWKLPVKPKFKVGDEIIWTKPKGDKPAEPVKIIQLIDKDQLYMVDMSNGVGFIAYDMQDYYKLVPKPHYDISNFKPFDEVLVRFCDGANWCCALFSHYCTRGNCHFVCSGGSVTQCIPFNDDTKHLLGTTDMPSEEYISW